MASPRLPSDWCFLGAHFNKDAATNRIRIVADYFACDKCYGLRVQARCRFLDAEDPKKPDSQPVPNPELEGIQKQLDAVHVRIDAVYNRVDAVYARVVASEKDVKEAKQRLDDHRM